MLTIGQTVPALTVTQFPSAFHVPRWRLLCVFVDAHLASKHRMQQLVAGDGVDPQ
jgi:hypothetical protein